ncbi:MAG TPA: TonB-dependent receptor [Candidatus Binatia bacterium]
MSKTAIRSKLNQSASLMGIATASCIVACIAPMTSAAAADKDEIIVTATKRAESVYDIPLSITAVDMETLERKGVRDLEELSRSVPGLVVNLVNEPSPKSIIIRGIAAADQTAATAAVYVDDTPLSVGPGSPDLKFFDLERVEILRGPQGTLFGASSMGGAIRYVTTQPNYDEFSGRARFEGGSVAHGNGTYEGQVAFGGPIVGDNVAFRASGFYRRDAGYIDRVDEDTLEVVDKNANTVESFGGRFALGFKPTDNIEAVASILYQESNIDDFSTSFTSLGIGNASDPDALPVVPLEPFQRASTNGLDQRRDRTFLPNLTINWDLGFAELTSSTSYMDYEIDATNDFGYFLRNFLNTVFAVPEPFVHPLTATNLQQHKFDAIVQEARLTSTTDGPFEWLVGGYYRSATRENNQVNPELTGLLGPDGFGLIGADGLLYSRVATTDLRELAAFGEVSYTLFERLKLLAGLRYTNNKISFAGIEDGPFGVDPITGMAKVAASSNTEDAVTPKFSATYNFTDEMMAYATVAKGFREGGVNAFGANIACAADLAALGLSDVPVSYDSDSLWSYEVGVKGQTERVSFEGAAYRIDWSDIQDNVALPSCGVTFIDNLGKARVQGIELSSVFQITEQLTLDANGSFTDAELRDSDLAPAGTDVPGVPKTTAYAALTYEFDLNSNWNGYLRGELAHVGKSTRNAGSQPATQNADAYQTLSLRAGLRTGPYEITVFADNLTDEHPEILKGGVGGDPAFYPGAYYPASAYGIVTIRPRYVGASLSMDF